MQEMFQTAEDSIFAVSMKAVNTKRTYFDSKSEKKSIFGV